MAYSSNVTQQKWTESEECIRFWSSREALRKAIAYMHQVFNYARPTTSNCCCLNCSDATRSDLSNHVSRFFTFWSCVALLLGDSQGAPRKPDILDEIISGSPVPFDAIETHSTYFAPNARQKEEVHWPRQECNPQATEPVQSTSTLQGQFATHEQASVSE